MSTPNSIDKQIYLLMREMGYYEGEMCRKDNDYRKFSLIFDNLVDQCVMEALVDYDSQQKILREAVFEIFRRNDEDPRLKCKICGKLFGKHQGAVCL